MIFVSRRALLVGAMALMLFPLMANAQAGTSNQQDNQQGNQAQMHRQQQRRLAMLAQKLNLTDDQKRQWMQIQRETGQKVRAARMDQSLSEEQMQAQLKEIHKQQKEQILALLTPEQQQELKSFWEEQKQKQQSDQSPGTGSDPGSAGQNKEGEKEDDLFAGMISDDPPAPQPQNKKPTPK